MIVHLTLGLHWEIYHRIVKNKQTFCNFDGSLTITIDMITLPGIDPDMIANNITPFEPTHPGGTA